VEISKAVGYAAQSPLQGR